MNNFGLSAAFLISLAFLAQIDVSQAGSSPHDYCQHYYENFESVYNQTLALLTEAFQIANQTLYNIDRNVTHAEYVAQIQIISDPWFEENAVTIQLAIDAASALTGESSGYISQLLNENLPVPSSSSALECLYEMLFNLVNTFSSYANGINTIGQVLADAQYNVGDKRPYLTSGSYEDDDQNDQ